MADFQTALAKTLAAEGGFAIRRDTGEVVNRGITAASFLGPEAEARIKQKIAELIADGTYSDAKLIAESPDVATIYNLTVAQTNEFYACNYWDKMKLDAVANQDLADKLFDIGVNQGPGTSIGLIQKAVNSMGHAVTVDHAMGTLTLEAINLSDPTMLLGSRVSGTGLSSAFAPPSSFRNIASVHYRAIEVADPRHAKDLPGWLDRLAS